MRAFRRSAGVRRTTDLRITRVESASEIEGDAESGREVVEKHGDSVVVVEGRGEHVEVSSRGA